MGVVFDVEGVFDAPLLAKVDEACLLLPSTGLASVLATGSGLGSHGNVFVLVELRRVCQPYQILSATGRVGRRANGVNIEGR